MTDNASFARQLRLRRLYRHGDNRLLVVPLDHSVTDGPVTGGRRVNQLVGRLAGAGADAVVLHKGALRYVDSQWFTRTSLILHLSASTTHAPDPDAKYLVAGVAEAVRLGADAVSVHVNLGSASEARQIEDLARVSADCDTWSMPLLVMIYPRGPRIAAPADPGLLAHAITLAADLGADIVKTACPARPQDLAEATAHSPVPVLVAGGPPRAHPSEVLSYVSDALSGGAAGVAMGRSIFQSDDPGALTARLSDLIHRPASDAELARIDLLQTAI
ncbi:2-amino-3,7-dideoxy-D-threo-hept-6-ulosonate synthase [Streptomyces sp. YU58]|uniref:2-amino-3,7-dideoxy-D-threo-hept-6-ulosonate synthase n=1 Tax=Streptomyces sp. SX92 TaxID=3158972 RepID=UPI0027B9ADD3|nr:2-amino-3,7-dideoxy-D-threo-hept-6-ulosonate synthase [Streptomyces coralus]WLW52460.1 2-amino-3,7-dideoxy-D-threo-hept-6-ulosonate synthase [Streptomyces coralus]